MKSKLEEVTNRLEEAIEEIKDAAFAIEEASPNDEVRSIMWFDHAMSDTCPVPKKC